MARRACNLGSEHLANRIAVKLFCRTRVARAAARRRSLGVGRIVPSSDAVRGSGTPRGERVPCTSTDTAYGRRQRMASPFRSAAR